MTRPLEFAAGSPALDLVDTVAARGRTSAELLTDPAVLADWLVRAGLLPEAPEVSVAQLDQARVLREAIFRSATAAIANTAPSPEDVDAINRVAAFPGFRPQLIDGAMVLQAADPAEAALSLLAADAIGLLTPPYRDRLRTCPGCNMVFVDRSRPGRRRWCSSSAGCGNLAKVRSFRSRKKKGDPI
ncbi:MAG: ABATE domain-containing protein [Sphingomonas sp.]|uniref:CGNR zinc finger domain-containing protein n=1 Tax=Sphingomonas sp. TaxID=28214 RepID=UPI001B0731CB|nr:ABATE domain-containing protein [Sphingomonas sp.]MBO9624680.1 ABATE domain-containing protein [Sphingomonas sp.]